MQSKGGQTGNDPLPEGVGALDKLEIMSDYMRIYENNPKMVEPADLSEKVSLSNKVNMLA